MDPAKDAFLSGSNATGDDAGRSLVSLHQLIADQIAQDNPAEVWRTARRLLDSGFKAEFVMRNLVFAASSAILAINPDEVSLDVEEYLETLDRLPLPPAREMFDVLVSMTEDQRSATSDELISSTRAVFGDISYPSSQNNIGNIETWIEVALDELLEREPSVVMLAPDIVVHVPTLLDGTTLTHRLTEPECSEGWVHTGADLAPLLAWSHEMHLPDGTEVEIDTLNNGDGILDGGPGWLEHFQPGTLIGFRVDNDTLTLESLDDPGPPQQTLVQAVRAAYEREVAEPWLPISADDIVAGLLLNNPGILSIPTIPLSELLASAGLEQRGVEFAHDESVWRSAHRLSQMHRLFDRLSDQQSRRQAARVFDLLDAEERDSEEKLEVLSILREPRLFTVIADELLDLDRGEEQLQEIFEFANDLVASARRAAETAPARLLLAIVCERRRDPFAGQAQLEIGVQADPEFTPVIDRLAW